jgi:malate permease and related proteins
MSYPFLTAFLSDQSMMVIRSVVPCLVIIYLGFIVGRSDKAEHEKTLSSLIYYIFSPCLVFSALHRHGFRLQEIGVIGGAAFLMVAAMLPIAWFLKRRGMVQDNRYLLGMLFMSTGSIQPPMAFFLFGNEGLAKAIIFHLFISLLFYSVGSLLVIGTTELVRFFRSPSTIVAGVSILVAVTPFSLPEGVNGLLDGVEQGIDLVGFGALPLLLLSLGYPLSKLKRHQFSCGIPAGLARIVLGPATAIGIIYLFRALGLLSLEQDYFVLSYIDQRTTEAVIILGGAMPASMSSYLYCKWCGNQATESLSAMFIGSMGGILTIPCVLYLVERLIFTY